MTILYLKDIKRPLSHPTGTDIQPAISGKKGSVVRLAERQSWWPNIVQCLEFPQQLRKGKNYAPSSSWLPEHSSQCLEGVHSGGS